MLKFIKGVVEAVKSSAKRVALSVGLAVGSGLALVQTQPALAQTGGTDYSSITDAAEWGSVSTGIIAVFAAVAAVVVVFVGGKFLLRALRG